MFKLTDCFAILGRRGCGKSYLCKRIQDVYPKKVIIDTLNEYQDGEIVESFSDFCRVLVDHKNKKSKFFKIVFRFNPDVENADEVFNEVLKICYKIGNLQIVIEEVQIFAQPHFLPHWFRQCLLTGRHQNLSMIFTTQRPGELNKTILSQCAHIFAGQMHEKNDLKYISSFLGVESEKLINLEPRNFLYWRPGEKTLLVKNTLSN